MAPVTASAPAGLVVRCVVYGCHGAPAGRFLTGYRCEAHAPAQPVPPVGTTEPELRRAAAVARGNDRAAVIARTAPRERAFHGTVCRSLNCTNARRHDHGAPRGHEFSCSPSCPCRKRWDLWKGKP